MPNKLIDIQLWASDRSAQIPLPGTDTVLTSIKEPPNITRRLGGVDKMTLTFFPGCTLVTATESDAWQLSQGKIIRLVYDDGSIQEWRIKVGSREFSGQSDPSVTAEPIEQDLKTYTVRKTLANGHTRASVSFYNNSFSYIVGQILSTEYNCPDLFTLGTVATGLNDTNYSLVLNASYIIDALKELSKLAEAEWDVSYNQANDNYEINFYQAGELGGGQGQADNRTISTGGGKGNRLTLERTDESEEYFSRVVPLMGEGSEIQTVAGARWRVDSYASPTLTLQENAIAKDGYGMIGGQTIYFGNEAEGWHEVTATTAPNKVTVSGDASGLSHGYFREGANKNEVILLEDSEALSKVGLIEEKFQQPNIPSYTNLVEDAGIDPAISDWSGGLPVGFQKIDGAETVSQEASDLFVKHGTLSAKVSCNQDEGLQTDTITLEPEDLNPYFSATLYLQVAQGGVRVELIDSAGKIHPKGMLAETNVNETRAIKLGGMEPDAGPAHIKIIAQADNTVFYLDAITLTQSSYPLEYAPLMGPKALWIEAGKYLKKYGGDRPDVWSGEVMDNAFFDGTSFEIVVGSFVKVQEDWNEGTGSYDTEFVVRVVEVIYQEDRVNGRYRKKVRLADKNSEAARVFQEQYLTVGSQQSSLQVREVPEKPIIDIDNAVVEGGTPRFEQVEIFPSTAKPPLVLGSNAQGELVTGLNAGLLDGYHASGFLRAENNLSELTNISVAQDNLGLTDGTADLDFNSLGINGNPFVDALRNITATTLTLSATLSGVDAIFSSNVSAAQATLADHLVRADRTLQFTTDDALAFDIETPQNLTSNRSWDLSIANHGPGQRGVIVPTTQTIYGNKTFNDYTVFSGDLSSPGAVSRILGWQGDADGNWDFRSIFSDSIVVKAFTADVAQAFRGSRFLTKSFATIDSDFVVPAVSSSATLTVREVEGFPGLEVFEQNDYILLNIINQSGGGLVVGEAWGEITSTIMDNGNGTQSFTFTTRNVSVPEIAGQSANEGSEALSFGSASDPKGFIYDTVLDNLGSPYSQVVTWTNNPWDRTNWTVRTRTGNLEGIANADGYGFYGNRSYLTDYLLAGDLTKQGNYLEYDSGVLKVSGVINVTGGNAATQGYVDGKIYLYGTNTYDASVEYTNYSPQPEVAIQRVSNDATWPFSFGLVYTYKRQSDQCRQVFYQSNSNNTWERQYNSSWTSWNKVEDVEGAQSKANAARDIARDNIAARLGYADYSAFSSDTLPDTLITGNTVRTALIDAQGVLAAVGTFTDSLYIGSAHEHILDGANNKVSFSNGILTADTNMVSGAGWEFWPNNILSPSAGINKGIILSKDNSTGFYNDTSYGPGSGIPNIGLTYSPTASFSERLFISIGETYVSNAWTGRVGLSIIGSKTGDALFEVSRDINDNTLMAQIAGWNIDPERLTQTEGANEVTLGLADGWTSILRGLNIGQDLDNRIAMGAYTSEYELRVVQGGNDILRLGTVENSIGNLEIKNSLTIPPPFTASGNGQIGPFGYRLVYDGANSQEISWYGGLGQDVLNLSANSAGGQVGSDFDLNLYGDNINFTTAIIGGKVNFNNSTLLGIRIPQYEYNSGPLSSGNVSLGMDYGVFEVTSASGSTRIIAIDTGSLTAVAGMQITIINSSTANFGYTDHRQTTGGNILCRNEANFDHSAGSAKTLTYNGSVWVVSDDHGA